MANPEHVAKLKEGVDFWNKWREEHPEVHPDLWGAILCGASLSHANLSEADLSEADLSEADLQDTNLWEAHFVETTLSGACLIGANLVDADLVGADFRDADLTRANLSGANLALANLKDAILKDADLGHANLSGANLTGADLSNAFVGWTTFGSLDLREVKGLETVKHEEPSIIGIDTFVLSRGEIPKIFLRNAGVPEPFIANMRTLVGAMSPIDFYSCFISYSSQNSDFATRLHSDLQEQGVRCWFAPEDLKIGDKFWHRIDESIRLYDKLLVVLSKNSVNSVWVEREVMAALEKEKQGKTVLFPIKLDESVMQTNLPWAADIRRSRHIGGFTNWKDHDSYQVAFNRLLRDLKAETR